MFPEIGNVFFRKYGPERRLKDFRAEGPHHLSYVVSGNVRYIIDGQSCSASSGDLLYLAPGSVCTANACSNKPVSCFSVDFQLYDLRLGKGAAVRLPFPALSRTEPEKDVISLFSRLITAWQEKDPGYTLKIQGLFLLILNRFYELYVYKVNADIHDFRIKKTISFIEAHYGEDISVKTLGEMIGLNPVYFESVFKKATGLPLHQYLIKTRMKKAVDMLKSGEYTVNDTAEACGYSDALYFYKQFKAAVGISPSKLIPNGTENRFIHTTTAATLPGKWGGGGAPPSSSEYCLTD